MFHVILLTGLAFLISDLLFAKVNLYSISVCLKGRNNCAQTRAGIKERCVSILESICLRKCSVFFTENTTQY